MNNDVLGNLPTCLPQLCQEALGLHVQCWYLDTVRWMRPMRDEKARSTWRGRKGRKRGGITITKMASVRNERAQHRGGPATHRGLLRTKSAVGG